MVTPQLKKHFAEMNIPLIDLQQGARWFVEELAQPDDVLVVLGEGRELSQVDSIQTGQHRFDVLLNAKQQPQLLDHTVNSRVVLPMVQVIEWFVRAVEEVISAPQAIAMQDVQVLSGIKLENFAEQQVQLQIVLTETGPRRFEASLFDAQGKPCYRAVVDLAAGDDQVVQGFAKPMLPLAAWPIDSREAYGEHGLFHGPAFQVIHALGSLGEDGGLVKINSDVDQHWLGAPFHSQPALLDGCLQLPVLWGRCLYQQHNLPIRIKHIRWFRHTPVQGMVDCSARISRHDKELQSDMLAVDAAGRTVLMLEGVEHIVYALTSEAL